MNWRSVSVFPPCHCPLTVQSGYIIINISCSVNLVAILSHSSHTSYISLRWNKSQWLKCVQMQNLWHGLIKMRVIERAMTSLSLVTSKAPLNHEQYLNKALLKATATMVVSQDSRATKQQCIVTLWRRRIFCHVSLSKIFGGKQFYCCSPGWRRSSQWHGRARYWRNMIPAVYWCLMTKLYIFILMHVFF